MAYVSRLTLPKEFLNDNNDLKLTMLGGTLFQTLMIRSLKKCFQTLIRQWLSSSLYGFPRVAALQIIVYLFVVQVWCEVETISQVNDDVIKSLWVWGRTRRPSVYHSTTLPSQSPASSSSTDDVRFTSSLSSQPPYVIVCGRHRVRFRILVSLWKWLLCRRVGVLRRSLPISASGAWLCVLRGPFPAAARRELRRRATDRTERHMFQPSRFFELQRRRHRPPSAHARHYTTSGRRQRSELWSRWHWNQLTIRRRLPVVLHGLANYIELCWLSNLCRWYSRFDIYSYFSCRRWITRPSVTIKCQHHCHHHYYLL